MLAIPARTAARTAGRQQRDAQPDSALGTRRTASRQGWRRPHQQEVEPPYRAALMRLLTLVPMAHGTCKQQPTYMAKGTVILAPRGIAIDVITRYNLSMKVAVRRIGNSLGVLLPKATLDAWGLGEGDALELTERGLRPPARGGFSHQELDELRRSIAVAIIRRFTPREIRAQILANLRRWKRQGVWGAAYDEWRDIAAGEDDGELFEAMIGRDEKAIRLRQSAPFVGLLSKEEVRKLNEEAAG